MISLKSIGSGLGKVNSSLISGGSTTTFPRLKSALQLSSGGAIDPLSQLRAIEGRMTSGKPVSIEEIVVCQIRMNRAMLHVELVSKVAECGSSTIKKLQNGQ